MSKWNLNQHIGGKAVYEADTRTLPDSKRRGSDPLVPATYYRKAVGIMPTMIEVMEENRELRAEIEEQARLLGKGGSREAALTAKVESQFRHISTLEQKVLTQYERVCALEEQKALLFAENGRLLEERESGQWDANWRENARLREALELSLRMLKEIEAYAANRLAYNSRESLYSIINKVETALQSRQLVPKDVRETIDRVFPEDSQQDSRKESQRVAKKSESARQVDSPAPCELGERGSPNQRSLQRSLPGDKSPSGSLERVAGEVTTQSESECPVCGVVGHAANCPDNPIHSEPVNTHGVGPKHCGRLGCELCMEAKRKQTEKEKAK